MKKPIFIFVFLCLLALCCTSCDSAPHEAQNPKPCSHEWTEATCTAPRTCTICELTEGEPLEHSWVEATCEKAKYCSICWEREGDPAGHIWNGEGTCPEPAICLVCQEAKSKPREHSWNEAECEIPQTCKYCSATQGEALGHMWEGGSCTEPPTCSYCYKSAEKPLEHHWNEATCLYPQFCSECGEEVGEALDHDWKDATCTEPKKCALCKKQSGNPLKHDYVDYYCTRCSDFVADSISELKTYIFRNYQKIQSDIGTITLPSGYVEVFYESDPWRTHDYEIIFNGFPYVEEARTALQAAVTRANFLPYEQRIQAVIDVLKAQMELAELVTIAFPDKKFEIKFFVEGYAYPALGLGYSSETWLCWKNYKENDSGINGYGSTDLCGWYIDADDFLSDYTIENLDQILTDILALWKEYEYPLEFRVYGY